MGPSIAGPTWAAGPFAQIIEASSSALSGRGKFDVFVSRAYDVSRDSLALPEMIKSSDVPLTSELKAEARKAILTRELATLDQQRASVRIDPATVTQRIAASLSDWQTTIRKHVPQARSMLRKLLRGRISVTPEERNGLPGFRFRGEGSVQKLLSGWLADFPQQVASLMPASWNRIVPWLRQIDELRAA